MNTSSQQEDPTPEHIAELTAAIQSTWSKKTRESRIVGGYTRPNSTEIRIVKVPYAEGVGLNDHDRF